MMARLPRSWPILLRCGPLIRMLEHTRTPYEQIYYNEKMKEVCSTWGADVDTFAPPVVVDGAFKLSQSIPTCLYLGKRLGLVPEGYDELKAMQYCLDIKDVFEEGLGGKCGDGRSLKAYVQSTRWALLLNNIERSIQVLSPS